MNLEDINGAECNLKWLNNNKNTAEFMNWVSIHRSGTVYSNTSCDVTAGMLRDLLQPNVKKWVLIDSNFEDVYATYNVFQIAFFSEKDITIEEIIEDEIQSEHILTIYEDSVLQSYFKHYSLRISPLDNEFINAINKPTTIKNYKIITGITETKDYVKSQSIFFWIPIY